MKRALPAAPALVGMTVLVVSGRPEQALDRVRKLEQAGYRGATADAAVVAAAVGRFSPRALVVDLAQEVGNPAEIVSEARRATSVPVVVVGCAGTVAEMRRCYDAGADDYARPLCPTEELDLRLQAIFRRMRITVDAPAATVEPLHIGDLEIDTDARLVRKRGAVVGLSPTEYRLLVALAENEGRVIPPNALIARVWGSEYVGEAHYLRLYIRYLRQKLEDDPAKPRYILNRWGAGYTLTVPAKAA